MLAGVAVILLTVATVLSEYEFMAPRGRFFISFTRFIPQLLLAEAERTTSTVGTWC